MPVLNFNEDERLVLDVALTQHRSSLLKEWGKIRGEDGRSPMSRDAECEWLDGQAVVTASLRDRVLSLTSDGAETQITEAEAKRRTAVAKMIISEIQVGEALHEGSIGPYLGGYPGEGMIWHHKHGWLQPTKYLVAAKADIEAGEITREDVAAVLGVDLAEVDAENARDRARQDQMSPRTWTTLPDEVDSDGWMFDVTDPESTTAGMDTQKTADGKVRIDITVGGKTLTVDGHESLLEALSDLNRRSL